MYNFNNLNNIFKNEIKIQIKNKEKLIYFAKYIIVSMILLYGLKIFSNLLLNILVLENKEDIYIANYILNYIVKFIFQFVYGLITLSVIRNIINNNYIYFKYIL